MFRQIVLALYASPDELGQAFNFELLEANFNAHEFKTVIDRGISAAKAQGSSSTWCLK
jgi:alpha-glucosidase